MTENTYMSPVSPALYKNQTNKYADIKQDYCDIKKCADNFKVRIEKIEKIQQDYFEHTNGINTPKELRSILNIIPTIRRIDRVPDKIEKKDNIPAYGLIALAALNLPEDMRDTRAAIRQLVQGDKFEYHYDYKKAQHPFSFFRGTAIHKLIDTKTSPFPKLAEWLVSKDTTLYETKFGKFVNKVFNIETNDVETGIKNMNKNSECVYAHKYNTKSYIGELTARALTRTTKIGAMVLAGIEAAHFAKEVNSGKNVKKELVQSAVTYISSIAGIGYLGAIGAKYFGPAGSIIGMGLGAVGANKISNSIDT